MKQPKIFLCWTLNSGTTFYRLMNFVKYMRKDFSFGFSKWSPDFQEVADWEYKMDQPQVQKDIAFLIDQSQMVIAQKFHWYGGLAALEACRKKYPDKPFYTELDDHVFAINPSSPAYESYQPGGESEMIVREQIINSTGLIVSTDFLRRVYEEMNPNIWVIPNAIDFDIWDNLKEPVKKDKKIRIGWAGGGAHLDDLTFIESAVDEVCKKFTGIEFVFLGGVPPQFKNKRKVKGIYRWHPINEYPQAVKNLGIDIALAPLRDNLFNRGKSNLRWLEYSAMKIPTVASNVEPFKCIENRKTGILVTEPKEWVEAISELIENESMRREIGENAYQKVKIDYNAEKTAEVYAGKIRLMLRGKANISKEAAVAAVASNGRA